MKRFLTLLAIALIGIAPAIVFRLSGWRPNPVLAVFGVAVLAAGFMLSWGCRGRRKTDISRSHTRVSCAGHGAA